MWKMIFAGRGTKGSEIYTEGMEIPGGVLVKNTTYIGGGHSIVGWVATSSSESTVFVPGVKLVESGIRGNDNFIMHKLEAL